MTTEQSITLVNGAVLPCFPVEMGKHVAVAEIGQDQEKLFVDNIFYLWQHKERILSDSRMFLAPVSVSSGLAYFGSIPNPTLGVYMEFWTESEIAVSTDAKGQRNIVYKVVGSPLTGVNDCGVVYEDGIAKVENRQPFFKLWRPFATINLRYKEAKQIYQHYTLNEVLRILHNEDSKSKAL